MTRFELVPYMVGFSCKTPFHNVGDTIAIFASHNWTTQFGLSATQFALQQNWITEFGIECHCGYEIDYTEEAWAWYLEIYDDVHAVEFRLRFPEVRLFGHGGSIEERIFV